MKFNSYTKVGFSRKEIDIQIKRFENNFKVKTQDFEKSVFVVSAHQYDDYIEENKKELNKWENTIPNEHKHKRINYNHLEMIEIACFFGKINAKIANSFRSYLKRNKNLTSNQLDLL